MIHISTESDFQKVLKGITLAMVRRIAIYDYKNKVVGVRRETEYYNNIDYTKEWNFVMYLSK